MPSHEQLQPVSAYLMYRKLSNNQSPKKKKKKSSKQLKTTLNSKTLTKKQKSIKKLKKITPKSVKEYLEETPPTLIEIKPKKTTKLTNAFETITPNTNILRINKTNDNPDTEALTLFKWLISPLTPEGFFENYWEKAPVHITRTNRNYYKHILSSASLDKIFRNNPLYYTRNVDVVSYENGVKEVHNQEGRAVPSALWDYYSNGCSIRVLNPQTYSERIHLLIAVLQEYFGSMVGTNVYLTPPGSQGFAPHYDDIEAFVIQLEGRKHWKLYQPKDSDVLARFSSPNFSPLDLPAPFAELTLNAGELLYFPRGTIHEGRTDPHSHSLHVTLSVYQRTAYADLLERALPEALRRAAAADVAFRRGLPPGYLRELGAGPRGGGGGNERREEVEEEVRRLVGELAEYVDVDGAADQLGRRFVRDSMPPVVSGGETGRCSRGDGAYLEGGRVVNRVEIELDTRIRLLRYYCIRLVVEENSTPKLYYNTENAKVYQGEEEQWLELEENMIPAIQLLQNSYPNYVEVEELPMEDVTVKMQLVSDLWEHGLLVTEEPLNVVD